jgi:uncharacterized protein (UPF0248 family)
MKITSARLLILSITAIISLAIPFPLLANKPPIQQKPQNQPPDEKETIIPDSTTQRRKKQLNEIKNGINEIKAEGRADRLTVRFVYEHRGDKKALRDAAIADVTTLPGYHYLGSGSSGHDPTSALDRAAEQHDEDYRLARATTTDKLIGAPADRKIAEADARLIKAAININNHLGARNKKYIEKHPDAVDRDKQYAPEVIEYFSAKLDQNLRDIYKHENGREPTTEEFNNFKTEFMRSVKPKK